MLLRKDNLIITLKNDIQIAAFLGSGWVEVKNDTEKASAVSNTKKSSKKADKKI